MTKQSFEHELELDYPITVDGAVVDRLTFRTIIGFDLEKWEKSTARDVSRALQMIADLTNLHLADVRQLDARDFAKAQEEIVRLMGKDPDQLGS